MMKNKRATWRSLKEYFSLKGWQDEEKKELIREHRKVEKKNCFLMRGRMYLSNIAPECDEGRERDLLQSILSQFILQVGKRQSEPNCIFLWLFLMKIRYITAACSIRLYDHHDDVDPIRQSTAIQLYETPQLDSNLHSFHHHVLTRSLPYSRCFLQSSLHSIHAPSTAPRRIGSFCHPPPPCIRSIPSIRHSPFSKELDSSRQ